jgi:hypothetical protein
MKRYGKNLKVGIVSMLVMLLLVSGCSKKEDAYEMTSDTATSSDSKMDYGAPEAPSMEMETDEETYDTVAEGEVGSALGNDGVSSEALILSERKIIKTGFMYMETLEYEKTLEDLKKYMEIYNAYTERSESNGGQIFEQGAQQRSSRYTIKVPAAQFELMFEDLKTIGHVLNANEGKQDITSQFVDIESRLKTLGIQEERLLAILEKSEKLEDIIQLEYSLQNVRYEIERYTSTLRNMDESVRYSTIEVNIQEVYKTTIIEPEPITFGDRISTGIKDTFKDIKEGFENLLVYLVVNAPYLIVTALVIILGIRTYKSKLRKSKVGATLEEAKKEPIEKE